MIDNGILVWTLHLVSEQDRLVQAEGLSLKGRGVKDSAYNLHIPKTIVMSCIKYWGHSFAASA